MKKCIVFALMFIILAALCSCAFQQTQSASLHFVYDGSNIHQTLTKEEAKTLSDILKGATLFPDAPNCGFTADISFTLGDHTYALARDNCPTVFDCDSGLYFHIRSSDRATIEAIFEKYGGYFPCL